MPDLDTLFRPRSIALIGASPDKRSIRGRLFDAVVRQGFDGPLYPVSRSHDSINGVATYATPAALPEAVDLAIVAIPAEYVADALEACGQRGVRAAVIISSGFAEEQGEQGAAREAAIRRVVERYDMAVLGPNSVGYMNTALPLAATFSPTVFEVDGLGPIQNAGGGIAVVSHSGGLAFSFFDRGYPRALRFSFVVSMGNEVGLETLDVIDWLLDDESTDVVLGFVEGLRTPGKFAHVASRAAALRKPLVLAKVGSSAAGARAAASHTATLTGSQRAYEAMFGRYGVIDGADTDSMLDIAAGFAFFRDRLPRGKRVAILTPSGGAGIWLADVCQVRGLQVPPLDAATRGAIDRLLPAYGTSHNPVDVTAQVIFQLGYAPVLEIITAAAGIDAVLVVGSQGIRTYLEPQIDELAQLGKRMTKPVIFCSYARADPCVVSLLAGAGFPFVTSMPNAARMIRAMADYRRFLERFSGDRYATVGPLAIPAHVSARLAETDGDLCEYQAKALLADLGITGICDILATSEEQAVAAAEELAQPVALKVQSPDIGHRSQAGGVALDLTGTDAVRAGYRSVVKNARRHHPHADIHGVLVSPMCDRGIETIIGVSRDADFGPMVMLGVGGTLVEVLDDVVISPAPASTDQVLDLLDGWKGGRLLDGSAGMPAADIEALVELVVKVSQIAAAAPDIVSLDLNPVVVHVRGHGVSVVDALIDTGKAQTANAGANDAPATKETAT
ncbi:MAG: acetate--CoA ligase family protein [Gammaproteobacteria bacterium]|nr:acetate--CoA ligase family protein [Gammaproteobacteria bacterium]